MSNDYPPPQPGPSLPEPGVPPAYGTPPPPPPGHSAPPVQPYGQGSYGQPTAPGYPQAGPGYPVMPGTQYGVDQFGRPYSDKSKIVAGILQLFLGGVGAGRWYTGHYGIAVAQLITCGGLGIWALIDGIILLVTDATDAQGRPLRS